MQESSENRCLLQQVFAGNPPEGTQVDVTGGPVVVITGNGHARTDWGAPHYVSKAAPGVRVFALGQGEAGKPPEGDFAAVVDGPAVDRGDPCEALR